MSLLSSEELVSVNRKVSAELDVLDAGVLFQVQISVLLEDIGLPFLQSLLTDQLGWNKLCARERRRKFITKGDQFWLNLSTN